MDRDDLPDHIPEGRCASCGAPIADAYCSKCGQRRWRRITFRRVFSEALDHLLNLDSAFLRTLVGLTKHPGRVCREYVLGQRTTYQNPLRYTFVMATLVLLVGSFVLSQSPDIFDAARRAILPFTAYLGYLAMLPVAAVQRSLFRRGPFDIAECYVFLIFTYGQLLLLVILLLLLFWLLIPLDFLFPKLQALARLISLAYFLWATAGFYRSWKLLTLLKGTVVVAALFVCLASAYLAVLTFLA